MTRSINNRLAKLEQQLRPSHRRGLGPNLIQMLNEFSDENASGGETSEESNAEAEKVGLLLTTIGGKTAEERNRAYDRLISLGEVPWGALIDEECRPIPGNHD